MSAILGIKLLLVPTLIGGVTLAGRRWGAAVAGWLSGFPIVAGPILFFIALDQGVQFGAAAAAGTLLGIPAVFVFNLAYSWTATKRQWQVCLPVALAAYSAAAYALVILMPNPLASALLASVILLAGARAFPVMKEIASTHAAVHRHSELVYRMLAAALLVALVTHFASSLGPRLSGLFAMFPVISIVLASFSHHTSGPAFTIRLLKGVIFGWYALGTFCLLLYGLLPRVGTGWGFLGAVAGAILVQLGTRIALRIRHV